jgi:hypothetical protein
MSTVLALALIVGRPVIAAKGKLYSRGEEALLDLLSNNRSKTEKVKWPQPLEEEPNHERTA